MINLKIRYDKIESWTTLLITMIVMNTPCWDITALCTFTYIRITICETMNIYNINNATYHAA